MTTIHKTRADVFNQMMESTSVDEMALFEAHMNTSQPARSALSLIPEVRTIVHWPVGTLAKCRHDTDRCLQLTAERSHLAMRHSQETVQRHVR
jgi:hypothetical protein